MSATPFKTYSTSEVRRFGDYMERQPAAPVDHSKHYAALVKHGRVRVRLASGKEVDVIIDGFQVWCIPRKQGHCMGKSFGKCGGCDAGPVRERAESITLAKLHPPTPAPPAQAAPQGVPA